MMTGADGIFKRDQIMESLRRSPLTEVAGSTARRVSDHWDQKAFGPFVSETDKLPRNVIQYEFDSFVITVRPSGTEPKLKFYCQVTPDGDLSNVRGIKRLSAATARAEKLSIVVYRELLKRIGVDLQEPALLLPDIVDLEQKQAFERRILQELREGLAKGRFSSLEATLDWLRREAAAMTPGADPMPALKEPLAFIMDLWIREKGPTPILDALQEWSRL
jgi:hypothetical protein